MFSIYGISILDSVASGDYAVFKFYLLYTTITVFKSGKLYAFVKLFTDIDNYIGSGLPYSSYSNIYLNNLSKYNGNLNLFIISSNNS